MISNGDFVTVGSVVVMAVPTGRGLRDRCIQLHSRYELVRAGRSRDLDRPVTLVELE